MKSKENQGIRSIGILSVFFMAGVCGLLSFPVWNSGSSDLQFKTIRRAEGLAYQILQARKEKPSSLDRNPASEDEGPKNQLQNDSGSIGVDQWGKPFQFAIVEKQDGLQKVVVWSNGPNGQTETSAEKIASNWDENESVFGGDDLGIIVSVK
jgi:hypothetical protein